MPSVSIKKKLDTPLSKEQLIHMIGCKDEDIIPYSNLRNYDTIDELLPKDKDFKILLLEEEKYRGHWVTLLRDNNIICYFNPYGNKPDRDMDCIPRIVRKMLGQDRPEITRLCRDYDIWYSDHKFQGPNSQVCGRYAVYFIEMVCKMNYTPDQAVDKLIKAKESMKQHKTYDELIASLTP
jgi:hypothetical protein